MKRLGWLVPMLSILLAAPAAASTFIAMTPRQMLAESAAVVQGRVLSVNSFWDAAGRVIVTEALLQVEEAVVGDAAGVLTLRTWGGTVGDFTVEAHGFPVFRVNERLLLFVGDEREGAARVVGYALGQYRIGHDRHGVEVAVPTLEADIALLGPDGRESARRRPFRLDAFKDFLRAEAARTARHAH